MKTIILTGIMILAVQTAVASEPRGTVDEKLAKIVGQCDVKDAKKHVWIFKQWHLGPSVNTHSGTSSVPQQENQRAIFRQIKVWVKNNEVKTVYSEGCTGEINRDFRKAFNGWVIEDLEAASNKPDYDDIVTLIPLKIKALFKNEVSVVCADDEKIIQKQNSTLSDARGNLGFLTRIEQLKNDPQRLKPYLEKIIELDHLSKNTTPDKAIARINHDLKKEIETVKKEISSRNKKMAEVIKSGPEESVFVVGGLHASGVKKLLEKESVGCTILEPKGYAGDEEKLFNDLESNHK